MVLLRRAAIPTALLLTLFAALFISLSMPANAIEPGVTESPRLDTMRVLDGEVLDSVVIGNRVIVAGTFTQVTNAAGNTVNQPYLAAYNADSGDFDGTFRPAIDNFVNAVEADKNGIYIVGQFSNVGGEAHRRVAKLDTNGSVNSSFQVSAGSTPTTLALAHGKLYVGGPFSLINGQRREALAAVDASTGVLDSTTNFDFNFSVQAGGGITVRWIEVSPDGSYLFATHSARFIDGENRTGIARFDISANATSLSNWQTLLYDNELDRFAGALRMRRLHIAPNGSYLVVVTSGGDRPPAGDTAVRFPTSGGGDIQADWVSRHFDTVLGVAINDDVVFVGGHFQFQEAPGSEDPFPGDPLTNFGFGQGQGPLALGTQVVQRAQLGALDPATGKSTNWNPGADSFIGVQSLTWSNEYGLLVGHDGSRLGGRDSIGRHGVFPTVGNNGDGGDDAIEPTGNFICTLTTNGNNATLTYTGDHGSSTQLLRNGNWNQTITNQATTNIAGGAGDSYTVRARGPQFNGAEDIPCTNGDGGNNEDGGDDAIEPTGNFICTLTTNGNNATLTYTGDHGSSTQLLRNGNWNQTITNQATTNIAGGAGDSYTVRARGPQFNGAEDIPCTNGDGGNNEVRGVTEITARILTPTNGAVVNAGVVSISGDATAPAGIHRVRLALVRRETGEYLNSDGSYTTEWAPLDIDLETDSDSAEWSIDVGLEFLGQYDLTARTFDTNGDRGETVRQAFIVAGATNDPPELIFTSPSGSITSDTLEVSGTATDDIGVQSVTFLIRNTDTNEFFRTDGSLGAAQSFTTELSNPGNTITNWTRSIEGLPVGGWQITAEVFDTSGQRDRANRIFSQAGNLGPPTISITSGAEAKQTSGSSFSFIGSASSPAGIENVAVLLRNVIDRSGVQANGALGNRAVNFVIPGTNGGTNATWSYDTPDLAAGTYDVVFRITDGIGATETVSTQIIAGPSGDRLPSTTFDVNRSTQGVQSLTVEIGGAAEDDNGVDMVAIGVFNASLNQWVQTDGSLGATPDPFFAELSERGDASTAWTLSFTAQTSAEYHFFVRAVDTAGQAAASEIFGRFRAFPGDAIPEISVALPTAGQEVTTNRVAATGSATDDISLSGVEIRILNSDTGQFLRADDSFGNSMWLDAGITNPGADRTNWDYSSPTLPDGNYRVQLRSVDGNGQLSLVTTRLIVVS